jgi:hypothetical protein
MDLITRIFVRTCKQELSSRHQTLKDNFFFPNWHTFLKWIGYMGRMLTVRRLVTSRQKLGADFHITQIGFSRSEVTCDSESAAIIWVRDTLSSACVLLAVSCEDTWQLLHNRPRCLISFVCLKYYWTICTHTGVLILIKSLRVSVQKEPSDALETYKFCSREPTVRIQQIVLPVST